MHMHYCMLFYFEILAFLDYERRLLHPFVAVVPRNPVSPPDQSVGRKCIEQRHIERLKHIILNADVTMVAAYLRIDIVNGGAYRNDAEAETVAAIGCDAVTEHVTANHHIAAGAGLKPIMRISPGLKTSKPTA